MIKIFNLIVFLFLIGCASIIKDETQDVIVNTYPSNANVEVRNSKGRLIKNLISPGVVKLTRSDGSYLGGENYQIIITKPNYITKELFVVNKINNWYWFGNLFFGGFIGWLLVDPITGRMYDLKPSEINEILCKEE